MRKKCILQSEAHFFRGMREKSLSRGIRQMKIYCDNCMGVNEVDEESLKADGYRAACQICGQILFIDKEEVEAILLRKNPIPVVQNEPEDMEDADLDGIMDSVAQSNITTTIAANIDLPKTETSSALLKVMEGPDAGLEYIMDTSEIVIGRRGCDINLNDRLVSRKHLSIEASGGRYLLKDLGSTNGSFLNGSPVSMEFIKHGDEIQVGSTLLKFKIKSMDSGIVVLDA